MGADTSPFVAEVALLLGGALLGLVVGVLFEDPLSSMLDRVVRRVRRRTDGNPALDRDEFRMGPLRTDCLIVEGDGASSIAEESVYVAVNQTPVELPDEMKGWLTEIAETEEARRLAGEPHSWNGPNYALERLTVSRSPVEEHPELHLRLRSTDFFTTLAAQQLDRVMASGLTPRQKYIAGRALHDVPVFLSCSLSVCVVVATADGQLLLSRRSERVALFPGMWSVSANEGVSREIDSQGRTSPNLYGVARRGLDEELGIQRSEVDLRLLAAVVSRDKNFWTFPFIGRLHSLTAEDLRDRWSRGRPDSWEHSEHEFIKFQPTGAIRHIVEGGLQGDWTRWAPAVYYLALVNEFGRESVERAIRTVSHQLKKSAGYPRRHGELSAR